MIALSEPRIVGRTVRIGRRWHALAWIIGRRGATCRIDPIGFTDRSRAAGAWSACAMPSRGGRD